MTSEVQGLEFYVSSAKAVPEIDRFEAGIDRITKALITSADSIEAFDARIDRLGRSGRANGLTEVAENTKQVATSVRELIEAKRQEIEIERRRAEQQERSTKARAEAIAKAREQAQVEKRDRALQDLAQEEYAVRLARKERERYRLTIEAEAAARRAGLAVGSAEYQDFVRRTVAVRELAAAQELADKRQTIFGAGLGRLGITATGVVRTIAQLTAGFGALYAVRSAVSTIVEAEDKLRILQSVSDATAEELQRLSDAANSLSLSTRFSFGDGVQTLINLAKAGATAEEAMTALPSVANLARAGLLSLDDAADTVIQTMAQFGLQIDQSSRIGDVLVKAADSTTSSVDSLADSLRKVGPVGREFGISLETVTAAIAQMQQSGVQARVAGTGLAQIFKQLADPVNGPEGAAEAIARLNLSFEDVSPRNFTAALDRLAESGLTLQDATALVGTEFDYLLTTLVRNREEVKQLDAALKDASGDAAAKAAATVGTLGDSFAKLGNAAQRFYREGGRSGASRALSEIALVGADALNVLSGDAEAMEKAGAAGYALATGAKAAGVAIAGIVTFNTLARLGSFSQTMFGAGKAVGALTAAVRANPIGALASLAASAAAAMLLFGDNVEATSSKLRKFRDEAAEAESVARRFDDIRRSAELAASSSQRGQDGGLIEALTEQLILLERSQRLGDVFQPAEKVLAAIEQAAPDTVAQLRRVTDEMVRISKAGEDIPQDLQDSFTSLRSDLFQKTGALVTTRFGEIRRDLFGGVTIPIEGFRVETEAALQAVSNELARLTGNADAAKEAIAAAAAASKFLQDGPKAGPAEGPGPQKARTDALREFLREKRREVELADLAEEKQRRARLLQEAANAAIASGRKLRLEDLYVLEAIARIQDRQAAKGDEKKRAEAVAKILRGLRDEIALLEQQGSAREALQKGQETLNALADLKVDTTSKEYQEAQLLLGVLQELLGVEEKRQKAVRGQDARDRRSNNAITQLEQEERLLRLNGAAREEYRLRIEAENQARQAGLAVGTQEFDDYAKRRVAVSRLAEAQQRLADIGSQAGDSLASSLEGFIDRTNTAREATQALFNDLAKLAYRQVVAQNLSSVLSQAGIALANYFGGGAAAPSSSPRGPTPGAGFDPYGPNLSGGVIPAMAGQVVDEFAFLRRGGQTISVAEGGATTPEGIFRLGRDNKGNLGVINAGGAGGDTYHMHFPAVRTAQDARAMRMTQSQRVKAAKSADRSGRIGLRPPQ